MQEAYKNFLKENDQVKASINNDQKSQSMVNPKFTSIFQ